MASRHQAPPLGSGTTPRTRPAPTDRTGQASIRGPRIASTAGSSVSAAATARPTTIAPAMPTERSTMRSNRARPARPTRTVTPLKNTARPAVATVAATASSTASLVAGPLRVDRRPPRELLPEPARHQQRVVDAQPEAQQGRQVEHEDAHRV